MVSDDSDGLRFELNCADARIRKLERELTAAQYRVETLERMDREAATYIESVICMRTGVTGQPPYVGWKGLGLALTEALDERDRLKAGTDSA